MRREGYEKRKNMVLLRIENVPYERKGMEVNSRVTF